MHKQDLFDNVVSLISNLDVNRIEEEKVSPFNFLRFPPIGQEPCSWRSLNGPSIHDDRPQVQKINLKLDLHDVVIAVIRVRKSQAMSCFPALSDGAIHFTKETE